MRSEWEGETARRLEVDGGGSMPLSGLAPKPPPLLVLYEDLADDLDQPQAVYGQYPRGLIKKMLPWLRADRHRVLHLCSGSLKKGEGIRVDIRKAARPDVLADATKLPRDRFPDGSVDAVMIDPPYTEGYAKSLYGVKYARPSALLREATRVVRPGGRIVIVHYITPKPVPGMRFVKAFGLSTGFDMPMRAVSIYERDVRNTSTTLSSTLIGAATRTTYREWLAKYGALPDVPLITEVDIEATRRRRSRHHDPGHCYAVAGWRWVRSNLAGHGRSAKAIYEAPAPERTDHG